MRRIALSLLSVVALSPLALTVTSSTAQAAMPATCSSITLAQVKADGFTGATGPVVTPYNYANPSKDATNALGTTIDFGAKALVVGCVSPADVTKLAAAAKVKGTANTHALAQAYMNYMVQQAGAGVMNATPVGGTTDYLDFGNGKQDGLGSTSAMGAVRLDAWVAGPYIFLGFSGPVTSSKPSAALVKFVKWTESAY